MMIAVKMLNFLFLLQHYFVSDERIENGKRTGDDNDDDDDEWKYNDD